MSLFLAAAQFLPASGGHHHRGEREPAADPALGTVVCRKQPGQFGQLLLEDARGAQVAQGVFVELSADQRRAV